VVKAPMKEKIMGGNLYWILVQLNVVITYYYS